MNLACCCCSRDATTRIVDNQLRVARSREQRVVKLLFLGTGESGKSTLFKQMRVLYGGGFDAKSRAAFLPALAANVVTSTKALLGALDAARASGVNPPPPLLPASASAAALVLELPDDPPFIAPALAAALDTLWADPALPAVAAHPARYTTCALDSAPALLGRVRKMVGRGYVPTLDDVLLARVRTTAIVEASFHVRGVEFRMYDVGGQRSERKRWLSMFSDATCVVFVAALSEYDQPLAEDPTQNRLLEAVALFGATAANPHLRAASLVLILNKADVFAEKIAKVPLRWDGGGGQPARFAGYTGGPNDPVAALAFIQGLFLSAPGVGDRAVFVQTNVSLDRAKCQLVMDAVRETISEQNLALVR